MKTDKYFLSELFEGAGDLEEAHSDYEHHRKTFATLVSAIFLCFMQQ